MNAERNTPAVPNRAAESTEGTDDDRGAAAAILQAAAGNGEDDSFGQELSVWPALLDIQRSLEDMAPEEQRRQKLEVGTNWPPRTSTAKPFSDGLFSPEHERTGYMFFQGPTPRTAVQEGLPSFFSRANWESMDEGPWFLPLLTGLGGVSFLSVAAVLVLPP